MVLETDWSVTTEVGNYESFLALTPPPKKKKTPKIHNFEKIKKMAGYIIVLNMCIIWGMVHDIKNENVFLDAIILHLCTKNHDHMMYACWDMACDRHGSWNIRCNSFLSFRAIFCLLTLLTTQKIKILKKKPADIIILHLCQMNDNQIIYVSWDIKLNRIFSHFGPFFCPFTTTPPTTQKIKILKNEKENLEISSFYTSAPKMTTI